MELRRATPADAPAITEIYLTSRAAAPMPAGIHPDDDVQRHVREVVVPAKEVWLAELADGPAGVLVLDGDHLDWLFVRPGAQGRGVGTALMDQAKTLRPDGLALWVFTSNAPAQRFYEDHGFRALYETDGSGNEERSPDIRYVWGTHPEAESSAALTR